MNKIKFVLNAVIGQDQTLSTNKFFIRFSGNHMRACLLGQLWHYAGLEMVKERGGWIYKTYDDWEEEICVGRKTISRAAKDFSDWGFLTTFKRKVNGTPKIHYVFDVDKAIQCLHDYASYYQDCVNQRVVPKNYGIFCKMSDTKDGTGRKCHMELDGSATSMCAEVPHGTGRKCHFLYNRENIQREHTESISSFDNERDLLEKDKKKEKAEALEKEFLVFWELYSYKKDRKRSSTAFKNLSKKDKQACMNGVPKYLNYLKTRDQSQAMASSWINGRRWEDKYESTTVNLSDIELPVELKGKYEAYLAHCNSKFGRIKKNHLLSASQYADLKLDKTIKRRSFYVSDRKLWAVTSECHDLWQKEGWHKNKHSNLYAFIKFNITEYINKL